MRNSDYTAANRLAWDQAAPVHARQTMDGLKEKFSRPGYTCFDSIETKILTEIGIAGKSVAQLCCNNARELLSLKNMGAGRCVGFDISEEFLAQGRELAQIAGLDCELVRTDVYDISGEYDAAFDLIYLTIGALCWLPDLSKFFTVVERLMAPGAWLFIYDEHPFAQVFEPDDGTDPPVVNYSYFRREPFVEETGLDYWSK
ncbi:MAG: class I SAM-dependent methyltransferase, partial [Candidatus Zixiibacteriota bacterium]